VIALCDAGYCPCCWPRPNCRGTAHWKRPPAPEPGCCLKERLHLDPASHPQQQHKVQGHQPAGDAGCSATRGLGHVSTAAGGGQAQREQKARCLGQHFFCQRFHVAGRWSSTSLQAAAAWPPVISSGRVKEPGWVPRPSVTPSMPPTTGSSSSAAGPST